MSVLTRLARIERCSSIFLRFSIFKREIKSLLKMYTMNRSDLHNSFISAIAVNRNEVMQNN